MLNWKDGLTYPCIHTRTHTHTTFPSLNWRDGMSYFQSWMRVTPPFTTSYLTATELVDCPGKSCFLCLAQENLLMEIIKLGVKVDTFFHGANVPYPPSQETMRSTFGPGPGPGSSSMKFVSGGAVYGDDIHVHHPTSDWNLIHNDPHDPLALFLTSLVSLAFLPSKHSMLSTGTLAH